MPTYAYACKNCGHEFDIRQSFSDDALTTCPSCGQESLRKQFGSVGVSFKGSGFYSTDARGSSSAASTGGSDSGSSTNGASAASSSAGSSGASADSTSSSGTSTTSGASSSSSKSSPS